MKTVSSLLLAGTLLVGTSVTHALQFTNLVVFGDSLSDVGNVYLATARTVPEPNYYPNLGHFTNGPTYAELMWEDLGFGGSLTPSLAGGTDYAFGGARSRYGSNDLVFDTSLGTLVPPPIGSPVTPDSFVGQINSYLSLTGNVADPDALYIGWTGGNDVRDISLLLALGQTADAQALFNQSIADVANALGALLTAGVRNLLVPTVTDLGLTPEAQSQGPAAVALITAQSQLYNQAIDQALLAFTGFDGLKLTRADTFGFLNEVVADPTTFGISNATDPCLQGFFVDAPTSGPITTCADPESFAFWDIVHPNSRLNELLAADFIAAVPVPMSLPLMMLGLAGIAAFRHRAMRSASGSYS